MDLKSVMNESKEWDTIARALFLNRQRDREVTDIRQFFNRSVKPHYSNIAFEDVLKLFRRLDKEGAGLFLEARGTKPARFKWDYSVKALGRSIESSEPIHHKRYTSPPRRPDIHARVYLREGVDVTISLPGDFTLLDAKKVANFILTLPVS